MQSMDILDLRCLIRRLEHSTEEDCQVFRDKIEIARNHLQDARHSLQRAEAILRELGRTDSERA